MRTMLKLSIRSLTNNKLRFSLTTFAVILGVSFVVASFVLTDGPHGVRRQPDDADHLGIGDSVPATCFPTASCLASSWDRDLVRSVGAALGREARASGVLRHIGASLTAPSTPYRCDELGH